jgi:hypothetical protein
VAAEGDASQFTNDELVFVVSDLPRILYQHIEGQRDDAGSPSWRAPRRRTAASEQRNDAKTCALPDRQRKFSVGATNDRVMTESRNWYAVSFHQLQDTRRLHGTPSDGARTG